MSEPTTSTVSVGKDSEYLSVTEAHKFIGSEFDGTQPERLGEFFENVETALKLVPPNKHVLFHKLILTKITGDARVKLLARNDIRNWESTKAALQEYYAQQRSLEFYACALFASRQQTKEPIAQWAHRLDLLGNSLINITIQGESKEIQSGYKRLIAKLVKASFIQGLVDQRIKQLVKSRGAETFEQAISIAREEEIAIISENERKTLITQNIASKQVQRTFPPPQTQNRSYSHVVKTTKPGQKYLNTIKTEKSVTSPTCQKCHKTGHYTNQCKFNVNCNYCHKQGHREWECRKKQTDTREGNKIHINVCEIIRCYNCGKMGHKQFQCRLPRREYSHRRCFNCGSTTHLYRDCRKQQGNYQTWDSNRKQGGNLSATYRRDINNKRNEGNHLNNQGITNKGQW